MSNEWWFYFYAATVGAVISVASVALAFVDRTPALSVIGDVLSSGPGVSNWVTISVSTVVFVVWSWNDSRRNGVRHWWLTLVSAVIVGLALALPLYLLFRHDQLHPVQSTRGI